MDSMEELDAALIELDWPRAELCRRLGLHRNTPGRWPPIPKYAVAYLELALEVRDCCDRVREKLKP